MFPDYPQIEQVRRRLWNGRVFGQAAVMVGAGFSRNAESLAPGTSPFPLWRELTETLYAGLYPPGPNPDARWYADAARSAANGGVLPLAYEYETAFGRQALEDVVARAIPDEKFRPGEMHRLLLSLPWSDVFTTNYDTLLERARVGVHERKYDVVRTVGELPGSIKPRIIKLHGSFPAYRPLILTQEDYRTYPSRFAPFVNTVQQALMENVLLLLGFSGEDPNFLQWIGWVRDRLGDARPPVYLCGVLDLSASRRRTLEMLNVVPIDLGILFTRDREPDPDTRHRLATLWLLHTLLAGEPPSLLAWPVGSNPSAQYAGQDPAIPPGPQPLEPDPFPYGSVGIGATAANTPEEKVVELLHAWQHKRERYPGWVVLPQDNRTHLWEHNTDAWLPVIHHYALRLSPPHDLFLVYELVWRLDRAMVPLSTADAELVASVAARYDPFARGLPADSEPFHAAHSSAREWDWARIRRNWVDLAFALARKGRETNTASYETWMDRLRPHMDRQPEWLARWHYETCQFHLYRGEAERVRVLLENWPTVDSEPFWTIRCAGLHAEMGSLDEARRIAEAALGEIRARQAPSPEDVHLLSEESWAMALLSVVGQATDHATNDWGTNRGRWERLAAYRCRAFDEINSLHLRLQAPPPRPSETKQETIDTYSGRTAYSYVFGAREFAHTKYRDAYALLRLAEETGVPPRCGYVTVYTEPLSRAVEWVSPTDPYWASASVVRWGNQKEVARWFDRVRLATMTGTEIAQLYARTLSNFEEAIASVESDRESDVPLRRAEAQGELLSRLAFRLQPEQRNSLLAKLIALHDAPAVRNHHNLHRPFGAVLARTLDMMDTRALCERLPDLLALPIPGGDGFTVAEPSWWPEPFKVVQTSDLCPLPEDVDPVHLRGTVTSLLRLANQDSRECRRRALLRLLILDHAGLLVDADRTAFAHVLWDRVDQESGLPFNTQFHVFALLSLPEVEPGHAQQAVRVYVTQAPFPRLTPAGRVIPGDSGSVSNLEGFDRYLSAWIYSAPPLDPDERAAQSHRTEWIDWSHDEVVALLREVATWWDDEKALLAPLKDDPMGAWRQKEAPDAFADLVPLFRRVILPRLGTDDTATVELAAGVLQELENAGIATLAALPESLRLRPTECEAVAQAVRRGLASNDQDAVESASEAVYRWIVGHARRNLPSPPASLLGELVNRAITRREPGLDAVLMRLADIVEDVPEVLNSHLRQAICPALDFLYEETELPDETARARMAAAALDREVYRLPGRRQLGARLVSLLSRLPAGEANSGVQPAPCAAFEDWRRRSETDPFPEVRRVWEHPSRRTR